MAIKKILKKTLLLTYAKVIESKSTPRQLGSSNTPPQESWGMFKPVSSLIQKLLKIMRIFRDAVGYGALHVPPDEFVGIKLGSVSGEVIAKNAGLGLKESFHRFGSMTGASVPQKNKTSSQMLMKQFKEPDDLRKTDILGMETNIKPHTLLLGRDADRRDRGYLGPSSGNFKNRRLSFRGPGPSDGWNQKKAALIEKHERDPKFFGLFLYAASYNASSAPQLFYPFLWLVSQVSGNSNPFLGEAARYDWGDTLSRNADRSPGQSSVWSKDQSSSRSSKIPLKEARLNSASGARLVSRVFQERVLTSKLGRPSFYDASSTNELNLPTNQLSLPQPTGLSLYPRAKRPIGDAVPALFGFHEVAWKQFIMQLSVFLLLLRKSIIGLYLCRHANVLLID